MTRAVVLVNFLAVVFLANGFEEDIPISDKTCNVSSVICQCGEEGQNFRATFQTCSQTEENTTALSDAYRMRVSRFCSRFAHCETCLSGSQMCATCPDGKSGRFCNEDTLATAKNHRHLRTKRNLCHIPRYMETNTYHCYQKNSTITCVQHCDEGHTFLDGETWKKIKCNKMVGDWSPHGFRECKKDRTNKCVKTDDDVKDRRKRSLCEEPKSMDTAEMFCKTSGNIRTCSVYCNQGYHFEGNVTRTVKCNELEGLWTPTGFEECQRIQRKKRSSLCPVPKFMETNTFTCHEDKTYTTCHQTCNHGYKFSEGTKRTIKCKNIIGTWKPHTFQQCTKIKRTKRASLCPVPTFMETNTFTCNENKTHITCQQKCNDGYRFREGTDRNIRCKKTVGIWKPYNFEQCISIKRKKRASLCAVPTFMETNTFLCSEINNEITCALTCKDGLSFREGSKRTIKCKTTVGIWKPNNFEQCT